MPNVNYTSPFGERVFAQIQSSLLTIPNISGAWNSAGAQYIRVTENSLTMTPEEPKINPGLKHGTASQLARLTARKSGSWSLNFPLAPSGTQAVAPDCDPLLQATFGGPGSLQTGRAFGNAWEYSIVDQVAIALALFGFQHGVTATGNRFSLGSVVERFSVDFGGNILSASVSGTSVAVVENETFAVQDSYALGGLNAFPTEPTSFTSTGNLINAFGGTLSINGVAITNQCDSFNVNLTTGITLKGDFLDTGRPAAAIFGARSADVALGFVNNDSSALATLKQLAIQNTPVPVQFNLGSVAGYRMYVIVNGVQLVADSLQDANGYIQCSFGNSASSVTAGASNDLVIGFS